MVKIRKNLLDPAKYELKCPVEATARGMQYIVVHNTANDAPAENEVAYMIRNDSSTSFNAAVDDREVVIGIPFDKGAFAAGHRYENAHGIHIEICYSLSGGARFDAAEQNAAAYIAQLLKERGWDVSHVIRHYDCDGKHCPHRTMDRGWIRFLRMIQSHLDAKEPEFTPYLFRTACNVLNIRQGPGTNYPVIGQIRDKLRYTIVAERPGTGSEKGWGNLKAGGWIALDWIKKA